MAQPGQSGQSDDVFDDFGRWYGWMGSGSGRGRTAQSFAVSLLRNKNTNYLDLSYQVITGQQRTLRVHGGCSVAGERGKNEEETDGEFLSFSLAWNPEEFVVEYLHHHSASASDLLREAPNFEKNANLPATYGFYECAMVQVRYSIRVTYLIR